MAEAAGSLSARALSSYFRARPMSGCRAHQTAGRETLRAAFGEAECGGGIACVHCYSCGSALVGKLSLGEWYTASL